MNKGLIFAVGLTGLAACGGNPPPVSGQGVGFGGYAEYELQRARREAALSAPRQSIVPPAQVTSIPASATPPTNPLGQAQQAIPSSELAQAGIGSGIVTPAPVPANTGADPSRTQGVDASPSNAAPVLTNNPNISDEQNFDAVANRESIESDAQRRAAQAAAREEIQPTAVPQRPSSTGPNIVEYALNAPNVKGQEWYSRSLLSGQGRFQRNCAGYATPDDAQRDFLARGGPERDRRGIDPDGDGFACGWDPAPFIQAVRN